MESPDSGSLHSLRELNRQRVVDAFREHGALSRADAARFTGLSRSTVSSIVSDLMEAGLVSEQQDADRRRPRRPGRAAARVCSPSTALRASPSASTSAIPTSASPSPTCPTRCLAEAGRELDVDQSAEDGIDAAAALVGEVLDEAGVDRDRVLGVGMGLPGPINAATGAVGSSSILPGWAGVDGATEMTKRLGLAVQVENDANLGALGEFVWGAGQAALRARLHQAFVRRRRRPPAAGSPVSRRRRDRGRDRAHPCPPRRRDLPVRHPWLPRDSRVGALHRAAARRQPRRGGFEPAPARAHRGGRPCGQAR